LKPISATRQNETELLPMNETLTNEKTKLTNYKLKRRLKPIKDESGKREKL
jgi:hypothetical protein